MSWAMLVLSVLSLKQNFRGRRVGRPSPDHPLSPSYSCLLLTSLLVQNSSSHHLNSKPWALAQMLIVFQLPHLHSRVNKWVPVNGRWKTPSAVFAFCHPGWHWRHDLSCLCSWGNQNAPLCRQFSEIRPTCPPLASSAFFVWETRQDSHQVLLILNWECWPAGMQW